MENFLVKTARPPALLMLSKQMEENRTTKIFQILFNIHLYFIFVAVIFYVNFCLLYFLWAVADLVGITFTDLDT